MGTGTVVRRAWPCLPSFGVNEKGDVPKEGHLAAFAAWTPGKMWFHPGFGGRFGAPSWLLWRVDVRGCWVLGASP